MGEDFRPATTDVSASRNSLLSAETRNALDAFRLFDSAVAKSQRQEDSRADKQGADKQGADKQGADKPATKTDGSDRGSTTRQAGDPIADAVARYFARQGQKTDKSSQTAAAAGKETVPPGILPNVEFVPSPPPLPGSGKAAPWTDRVKPQSDGGQSAALKPGSEQGGQPDAGKAGQGAGKPEQDTTRKQPDAGKAGQDNLKPEADKTERPAEKLELHYATKDAARAAELAQKYNLPLVVHVGATWCPPCRGLEANVWPKVEPALKGKAVFLHIDVDQAQDMQGRSGEIARHLMQGGGDSIPKIFIATASRAADGQATADVAQRYNGNRSVQDVTNFITRFRK